MAWMMANHKTPTIWSSNVDGEEIANIRQDLSRDSYELSHDALMYQKAKDGEVYNTDGLQDHNAMYREIYLEQGSDEWLEWRSRGIGASDAPAIMGENRFKSADELLHKKIHKINEPVTFQMAEGLRLEPKARAAYQKETMLSVEPICIESIEHPWLRASIDGISIQRDSIVEIKCGYSAMRKARRYEIPEYYYAQLQHLMMITGLDTIAYWCYRPEDGGILLEEERDDSYVDVLFQTELEFYNNMKLFL